VQRWAAAYELRDATVLFPAGSLARSTLEDELAMRGARVQRVEAYRTRPTPPERAAVLADLAGGVDAVTLASPSAVGALVDCLGPDWPRALDGCELVAIGPSTRAAVVEAGLPAARVTLAERSSVEGVVQATARALSMRRAPAGGMQR
jgi:uroporphyrinogen-III synthase